MAREQLAVQGARGSTLDRTPYHHKAHSHSHPHTHPHPHSQSLSLGQTAYLWVREETRVPGEPMQTWEGMHMPHRQWPQLEIKFLPHHYNKTMLNKMMLFEDLLHSAQAMQQLQMLLYPKQLSITEGARLKFEPAAAQTTMYVWKNDQSSFC